MPFPSTASIRPSTRRLGLLGVAFALMTMAALVRSSGPPPANEPAATLRPARNPDRLHLLLDAQRVFGWIGGARKHAGETVLVASGGRAQRIKVGRDNTFSWPYKVAETTRAEFAFGRLRQTIVLRPPSKMPPCVFFVVDRGVYRPNQTLHFAAFLRDLDERGEFVPRPAQTVEVLLTGEQKKTTAARMKLTADEQGRLTGEYTFSDADPLDNYRLSIPDYKGAARVRLAEYRKTKVHLNILSRREGSQLQVRFQARDYLDRPVTNARVQFVAQIVREPARPPAAALDGKQFAYAEDEQAPVLRLEDLTAEERLLAEADEGYEAVGGLNIGRERQVVHQIEGKLDLNGQGEGVYPIELRKDWLQADRAVVVRGVMIDGNGREERRTKSIPLTENDDSLQLNLPRSTFHVNDPIRVTARTTEPDGLKGSVTLVATRLSPSLPSMPFAQGNPIGQFGGGIMGGQQPIIMSDWGAIRRNLATAVIFKGDTAALRLSEPGAYMLTAIWHKPDGTRRRQEIGCAVLSPRDLPALSLRLDRDIYQAGDTVTASVRSQYADACVLVTLRDSVGLRLWETIRLRRGQADVKLPLPADARYGCAVEVHYADSANNAEPAQVASRVVHVVPARRMLTIHSEVKPILDPGEKAILNLQINRKEPVDLIVSVYDKALRKIASDQSTDIHNFYLADERIYQSHAREVLRRRLGEMTLDDLFKQAVKWLQEHPERGPMAERTALQALAASTNKEALRTPQVAALLRLAGVKTRAVDALHNWPFPDSPRGRRVTVWEWLNTPTKDGWRLHYSLVGDTFLLTAYHPTTNPQPWKTKAAIHFPSNSFNGGFRGMANLGVGGGVAGMYGGMMGMAGPGGIGGIAGLGGGGFNQLGVNRSVPQAVEQPRKPRYAALSLGEDSLFG
ncbi:MAG TPA: MG2 domain-containing protein, partial [Gemmataceae bacterium]